MGNRPDSGQERRIVKAMRVLTAAIVWSVALLAAPPARAPPSPRLSGRTAGPSTFPAAATGSPTARRARSICQSTPSTPSRPARPRTPTASPTTRSATRSASASELGLGNMQATLGVRMAEPLASNGFTPSFDPRRYLGVGPRVGFEGNQPLHSSWVVEWQVGAALLSGNRTFDTGGGVVNSAAAEFRQQRFGPQRRWTARPVVLVRHRVEADARLSRRLFQRLVGFQHRRTAADNADRVDHGPMVRFSIQK